MENKWIRNNGYKTAPASDDAIVDYRLRGGDVGTTTAGRLSWKRSGSCGEIMAWRYAQPQEKSEVQETKPTAEYLRDEYRELTKTIAESEGRRAFIELELKSMGFA